MERQHSCGAEPTDTGKEIGARVKEPLPEAAVTGSSGTTTFAAGRGAYGHQEGTGVQVMAPQLEAAVTGSSGMTALAAERGAYGHQEGNWSTSNAATARSSGHRAKWNDNARGGGIASDTTKETGVRVMEPLPKAAVAGSSGTTAFAAAPADMEGQKIGGRVTGELPDAAVMPRGVNTRAVVCPGLQNRSAHHDAAVAAMGAGRDEHSKATVAVM